MLSIAVGAALVLIAETAAAELSSASYRLVGGHISAGGASASGPSFSTASALGQSEPTGASGTVGSLETLAPGFFPIVVGDRPDLDLDGDGIAYFLDSDDDGDGIDDVVESNSGIFVSVDDTGTDSLTADTDGDGADDGVEVASQTDPNDPLSTPGPAPVPTVSVLFRMLIGLSLSLTAIYALRLPVRRHTA